MKALAEVRIVQEIDIGVIAVVSNSVESSLAIDRFGNYAVGDGFRLVVEGEPGIFIIENMFAQTTYNVQVSIVNTNMTTSGNTNETFSFEIQDYDQIVTTDIDGNAFIRLGGRITKTGSGNTEYAQSDFQSRYNLTINQ